TETPTEAPEGETEETPAETGAPDYDPDTPASVVIDLTTDEPGTVETTTEEPESSYRSRRTLRRN
ncbi:hypothetical protein F444_00075, partial [Phytophthora nicotianae P1976]